MLNRHLSMVYGDVKHGRFHIHGEGLYLDQLKDHNQRAALRIKSPISYDLCVNRSRGLVRECEIFRIADLHLQL